MSKIGNAIGTINRIHDAANRDQWVNSIHPLVKLLLTILYIGLVVSCAKYDILRVLGFMIYPIVMFPLTRLSFRECIGRIRMILPLVCLIGAFNPILDRTMIQMQLFSQTVIIRAGWLSMGSLILKGILAVIAAYLLIATTTIEKICYAMQILCVPKILITQVLLTYRYISLLLEEADRVTQAYSLRAPNQKGVHYKVWGSLVGQLLLRNIDRADAVYESMLLRGYNGSFAYLRNDGDGVQNREEIFLNSILFGAIWLLVFVCFRHWPVLYMIGGLFR